MAENLPKRHAHSRDVPLIPALRKVVAPKPPKHLSREARAMWAEITEQWILGPDATPLLRAALESWDLYQTCRAEVASAGPTVQTGEGMVRQHPAVKVGNDALTQFRQCFRQLGLEPPQG